MTDETFGRMWNILKENDFQIDVAVKLKIICTSCKNILIRPHNVPCGCRYCHDCLISYLNGEDKFCLGESEDCKIELINIDKNVFPDQAVNRKISRIVVKCPLESCEFNTELRKMADHMSTCERQPVTCPYHTIGCDENKINVDKMEQHLKQENYCHARLLMDFVDNWRNEMKSLKTNMIEEMETKQKAISALEENVAKLLQENKSLKELETEKSRQKIQIEEIILTIQTKAEEQNQGIKANKQYIEEITREIIKQLIEIKEHQNYGEYLWCIKEIPKHDEYHENNCSDAFYSHKNGYKMFLKFSTYETDPSLYVTMCIMRGEFDNILQWPFVGGVKLFLLNQKTGMVYASTNVRSENNPQGSEWQKPTSEINNNNNYSSLIKLSELSSNAALCKGNQIWIKATFCK